MRDLEFIVKFKNQADRALKDAEKAMGRVRNETRDADKEFKRLDKSVNKIGASLGKIIAGLSIGLIFGRATKDALDFERSLVKIETLTNSNAQQVAEYRTEILRMSNAFGSAPKDMAEAMLVISSAGLQGAAGLNALEASTKASILGLGEQRDIARVTAGVMFNYGDSIRDAAAATDIILATAREGNFEVSQLAGAMGRVLPTAKGLGLAFDEVGGAIAILTKASIPVSQAVTSLNALFINLSTLASERVTPAMREVGLTSDSIKQKMGSQGLLPTLVEIHNAIGGNETAWKELIGTIEGVNAVNILLGGQFDENMKTMEAMRDSVGSLDKSFGILEKSSAFKVDRAMGQLRNLFTDIGGQILPELSKAMADIPMEDLQKAARGLGQAFGALIKVTAFLGQVLADAFSVASEVMDGFLIQSGKTWQEFSDEVQAVVTVAGRLFLDFFRDIQTHLKTFGEVWSDAWGIILRSFLQDVKDMGSGALNIFESIGAAARGNLSEAKSLVRAAFSPSDESTKIQAEWQALGSRITGGLKNEAKDFGELLLKEVEAIQSGRVAKATRAATTGAAKAEAEQAYKEINEALAQQGSIQPIRGSADEGEKNTKRSERLRDLRHEIELTRALAENQKFLGLARSQNEAVIKAEFEAKKAGIPLTQQEIALIREQAALEHQIGNDTAQRTANLRVEIELQRSLNGIKHLEGEARAVAEARLKLEAEAKKAGIELTKEEIELTEQLAALKAQESPKDALTGIKDALRSLGKEYDDIAAQTNKITTDLFNNMEDALVNFTKTGKLDFRGMIDSMVEDITRLAIKQGILKPLQELLLGKAEGAGGGGFLGGLFGGGGGGGGLGGLFSGLFSFLPKFAGGGDFLVGGSGGTDSQLVAFRASPNERVSITTPQQQGSNSAPIMINYNITTPDADSFRRSQSQILSRTSAVMARASARKN